MSAKIYLSLLPSAGLTSTSCYPTAFSHGRWSIQLMSSCLCSKCITNWATAPPSESVFLSENGVFSKSLCIGGVQGVMRFRLRTPAEHKVLQSCLKTQATLISSPLPFPFTAQDRWPSRFHASPPRKKEEMPQKKETPGGKIDKSDITQPLNLYLAIFTIWATKWNP